MIKNAWLENMAWEQAKSKLFGSDFWQKDSFQNPSWLVKTTKQCINVRSLKVLV